MILTREEIKQWVKEKDIFKNGRFVPKIEIILKKNILVSDSIIHHTASLQSDTLYERLYYILNDIYEQKLCPVCSSPISYNKHYCNKSCAAKSIETKNKKSKTYFQKTGYTNPSFNPTVLQKISDKNKQNFEIILSKRKDTLNKKTNLVKEVMSFCNDIGVKTQLISKTIIFVCDVNMYIVIKQFDNIFENKPVPKFDKKELCIFESEWLNPKTQDIWKSILKCKFNRSEKIYARRCEIKEIKSKDAMVFLDQHHLQGKCGAKKHLGLYHQNELVCILSIGESRYNKKFKYEIVRFCNKKYLTVLGGFSKLLKEFRRNNEGSIITYADKRFSEGTLYIKNNFEELVDSKPNYFYYNYDKILLSRLKFQKHKLKDVLPIFNSNESESKNMYNNGYYKIWDYGNKVFILI